MALLSRIRDCRSGSTALEFAIVSLFLILICIGIIDFGRGLYVRNDMSFAADKGARLVLIDSSSSDSAIESAIRAAFNGPEPGRLNIALGSETVDGVTYRTVTLTYPLALKLPGFTESPIDLSIVRRIPAG